MLEARQFKELVDPVERAVWVVEQVFILDQMKVVAVFFEHGKRNSVEAIIHESLGAHEVVAANVVDWAVEVEVLTGLNFKVHKGRRAGILVHQTDERGENVGDGTNRKNDFGFVGEVALENVEVFLDGP